MKKEIIEQWVEMIKKIFPVNAEIEIQEKDDILLRIDWELGNDPQRPHKRSRIILIIISREAIKDCQDYIKASTQLKMIIQNRFSNFNPNHDNSILVAPPVEQWIITTEELNG